MDPSEGYRVTQTRAGGRDEGQSSGFRAGPTPLGWAWPWAATPGGGEGCGHRADQRWLHRSALLFRSFFQKTPQILSWFYCLVSYLFVHIIYLHLLQEQKLCLILPLKNSHFLMLGSAVNSLCVAGYFELTMAQTIKHQIAL